MSSTKRITTVDSSTSFDKVFVNDKDAIKQVSKSDFLTNGGIAKATDMEQAKSDISTLKADYNDLDDRVSDLEAGGTGGGGGSAAPMESITWAALKAKRDGGTLTPGMQYRITDYVCTTTQAESRAVNHPYDIIVTADTVNKLNESARACLHEGDNYYSAEGHSANLKAWELKYCLDNDTSRFSWADATNGKGVVYYLKDEHNNECPYDFKQIQFKRYKITECEKVPSLVGSYTVSMDSDVITGIDKDNPVWGYTFSYYGENIEDATVLGGGNVLRNNIAPLYQNDRDQMALNNIVFFIDSDGCNYNTFGNVCGDNTFGNACSGNTFGNSCFCNIFGNSYYGNVFGNSCYYNTFDNDCSSNTFGDSCFGNVFGSSCLSNVFGNSCYYNTFGNNCSSNTFGNNCSSNTFGNGCLSNTFGNVCNSNILENDCGYLKGTYNEINGTTAKLCHVLSSTHGSSDQLYELPAKSDSDPSVTYVGMKSDGTIVTWIPADGHTV